MSGRIYPGSASIICARLVVVTDDSRYVGGGRGGKASLRGGVAERVDGAEDKVESGLLARFWFSTSSSSEYPPNVSPSESTSFGRRNAA